MVTEGGRRGCDGGVGHTGWVLKAYLKKPEVKEVRKKGHHREAWTRRAPLTSILKNMAKIATCFVRYYSIGWLCLINWFWLGSNIWAIHNMCYWPKNLYSRVQMKTSGYWMSTGNWEHLGTGKSLFQSTVWYTTVLQGPGGSAVSGVIAEMMNGQGWTPATEYKKIQRMDTNHKCNNFLCIFRVTGGLK